MRSAGHLRTLAVRALELLLATAIVGFLVFLPFAGRFFDDPDPLEKADLILVLAGSRVERWLEAVDLYNERWAPRLVISSGIVARIEPQLRARGIKFPREGDIVRDAVLSMGLPPDAVSVLPEGVDNTAHEAAVLQRMLPAGQISRIIVVTSPYHTRRVGFAFRRAFAGTDVRVIVRGTRYSDAEPARWWRHRADIRDLVSEMPKYVAYVAGLAE